MLTRNRPLQDRVAGAIILNAMYDLTTGINVANRRSYIATSANRIRFMNRHGSCVNGSGRGDIMIIGFDIAARRSSAAPSMRSPPWVCSGLRNPRHERVSRYTHRGRSWIVIRYACTACGNGDYARSLLPSHTRGGPRADAGCAACGRWPAALLMALASLSGRRRNEPEHGRR